MLAYLHEEYPDIPKKVVFADTGWEHPDAESWCRNIVEHYFGLPLTVVKSLTKNFLTMVEHRKKFPGMQTRQCTSDLKRGPIMRHIRNHVSDPIVINCLGMRAQESAGRAKLKRLSRNRKETNGKRTIWNWHPILNWTEEQVSEYLRNRSIPIHPVYKHLRRFSCQVCIFMTQHDLNQVAKHDPEAIQIIDSIEKRIGFTMFQKGPIKTLLQ